MVKPLVAMLSVSASVCLFTQEDEAIKARAGKLKEKQKEKEKEKEKEKKAATKDEDKKTE